jgi:hypothetical protein
MNEFYLNVDSRDRLTGIIENFQFQYSSKTEVNYNDRYICQLTFLEFPAGSIYQVNSNNNTLAITINNINHTCTVSPGNYTILEFISQLQAQINTFVTANSLTTSITLSYLNTINKVGALRTNTNQTAIIRGSFSTCNELIGLQSSDITLTTSVQYFNNCVDMSPLDYIFINCSEVFSPSYTNDRFASNNILFRVQIAAERNAKIYLSSNELEASTTLINSLKSNFNFYLTDRLGRTVSTNGINYSLQLKLTKIN